MLKQQLLNAQGFLYQVGPKYYFLGKWICSLSEEVSVSDCLYMFHLFWEEKNHDEARFYFLKLRACCDFALEIPYNPQKIESSLDHLLSQSSSEDLASLEQQYLCFEKACELYQ